MAHVNSLTVQTTEGPVEVTKTSTHRDYVAATVLVRADGSEAVLVWHLTEAAAAKYVSSKAARDLARYDANKTGLDNGLEIRPVTTKLTGKDAKAQEEAPVAVTAEDAPAVVFLNEAADKLLAQDDAYQPTVLDGSCRCGCGLPTSKTYRPGHDARHAGAVARDIASSSVSYFERVTADSDLGSQALIEKAHRQAERLIAKMQKAAAKNAK